MAKQLEERNWRTEPTASQDSPPAPFPVKVKLEVGRLNHPRLEPSATNLSNDPVGRIGCAFIWWDPQPEQGKARPVLIVRGNASHLWIRLIFTRDFKAGLWRAVVINNWRGAGLDHESFVSPDGIRINRSDAWSEPDHWRCSTGIESVEVGPTSKTNLPVTLICPGIDMGLVPLRDLTSMSTFASNG